MKKGMLLLIVLAVLSAGCSDQPGNKTAQNITREYPRFFNDTSFWNQPIGDDPEIDPMSSKWIRMLEQEPTGEHFSTIFRKWTIPLYEVDENTKYVNVGYHYLTEKERAIWLPISSGRFGHGPGFNPVPIPEDAMPDSSLDAHIAIVDWKRMVAWDMWGMVKKEDGSWESNTGMFYRLDGNGVFNGYELGYVDNESVHFHGPSRAAGVPVIAGLIRYDEVMAGEIRHKLSCGTRFAAKQTFVYPASWTDGYIEGAIPEGAVIQLDPDLDLSQFELTKEEIVVARALQKYGMVVVDIAQGQPIYAERLSEGSGRSWEGKLHEWKDRGINAIPYKYYRILKVKNPVHRGDIRTSVVKEHMDTWLPEPLRTKVRNILEE